ncbi:MAG: pilus assembly protein TadG-related protein [Terriglobales bacterium]
MPWQEYCSRRSERGQTILLVAVSMVSLLAMAALAIDVVTLYVARTEIQRAADAAALAGGKALADSGITTLPPADASLPAATILARSMATAAVLAVVNAPPVIVNQVAGSPPVLVGGVPTFNFTPNNNPTVTVTLQQTNLPTFFARIFGQHAATTSATAVAEAYNPSNLVGQSNFPLVTPRCVKPWLVANMDPTNGNTPFIDQASGAVLANLTTHMSTSFNLQADCRTGVSFCQIKDNPMTAVGGEVGVEYLPMLVSANPGVDACPSGVGATNYEEGVACCNAVTYSCGGGAANADWDSTINPEDGRAAGAAALSTELLIHATDTGLDQGQDALDSSLWPNGPPKITAGTRSPMSTQVVTTSASIVTIPIVDNNNPFSATTGPVTIVGFLQGFVNKVEESTGPPSHVGEINITVLNVVGCSSAANGNPPIIGGNGASTIPVRLISPQ